MNTAPGEAIVVWTDYRSGGADIYAQHLPLDQAVPVQASLVRAEPVGDRVELAWRVTSWQAWRIERSVGGKAIRR